MWPGEDDGPGRWKSTKMRDGPMDHGLISTCVPGWYSSRLLAFSGWKCHTGEFAGKCDACLREETVASASSSSYDVLHWDVHMMIEGGTSRDTHRDTQSSLEFFGQFSPHVMSEHLTYILTIICTESHTHDALDRHTRQSKASQRLRPPL